MTRDKIKEDLNNIFRDIFEDAHINVTDETTAKEVERWDSVSHIDMICMVEDAFKVKLRVFRVHSCIDQILRALNGLGARRLDARIGVGDQLGGGIRIAQERREIPGSLLVLG